MFRFALVMTVLTFVAGPASLCAQLAPTAAAPVDAEKTVIRTYDLGDLLRVPRNYPLPPSMVPATRLPGEEPQLNDGTGGQGLFGGRHPVAQQDASALQPATAESIAELITGTVAPESWRTAGGAVGSLRFIGPRLVVSQTVANQKQIEELLNGIREEGSGSYMVAVHAYWVHFSPDDLRAIAGKPGDAASAATLRDVSDAVLSGATIYARGQTLGFNGQTVHVASGRANTVIKGMQPIVGTQAVGYQLETATVQTGVALQVTPQVLADGKAVSLDLQSIVSALSGDATLPDPRAIGPDGPTTQPIEQSLGRRPSIAAQHLSTTARVPAGKKVLIGGMTFDPAAADNGAKQLYLVVEANAIK